MSERASVGADRLRIGMVAGERSGDLLAASVLQGLRAADPQLEAFGVGGPAMRAAGFESWADIERLSVMGYVAVLKRLPSLLTLRARLARRFPASLARGGVFVGIDAPDFNLGLEERLRRAGVRTIHFVSPSIWAWRRERIETIRRAVDHMLLVFPFEQAIYDQEGIPATYVGHPLADLLKPVSNPAPARDVLGLSPDPTQAVIGLLPGSRVEEVRYLGKLFIDAAIELRRRGPSVSFVMPAASPTIQSQLQALLRTANLPSNFPLKIVSGHSHQVMAASDALLVASGTATLEAALIGRPMVIAYRMGAINYRLMRDRAYLPWIGLPNILAQDSIVPEFIQDQATPTALATALAEQLDDHDRRHALRARLADIGERLRCDCAAQSARVIRQVACA